MSVAVTPTPHSPTPPPMPEGHGRRVALGEDGDDGGGGEFHHGVQGEGGGVEAEERLMHLFFGGGPLN